MFLHLCVILFTGTQVGFPECITNFRGGLNPGVGCLHLGRGEDSALGKMDLHLWEIGLHLEWRGSASGRGGSASWWDVVCIWEGGESASGGSASSGKGMNLWPDPLQIHDWDYSVNGENWNVRQSVNFKREAFLNSCSTPYLSLL